MIQKPPFIYRRLLSERFLYIFFGIFEVSTFFDSGIFEAEKETKKQDLAVEKLQIKRENDTIM